MPIVFFIKRKMQLYRVVFKAQTHPLHQRWAGRKRVLFDGQTRPLVSSPFALIRVYFCPFGFPSTQVLPNPESSEGFSTVAWSVYRSLLLSSVCLATLMYWPENEAELFCLDNSAS